MTEGTATASCGCGSAVSVFEDPTWDGSGAGVDSDIGAIVFGADCAGSSAGGGVGGVCGVSSTICL